MYWGFDTKTIDKKVRPQDDFYRYANGVWLTKTKIPAAEARWGSFTILRYKTEQQLKKLVEHTSHSLVAPLYTSAKNMKLRNKAGIAPLAPLRMLVRDITTRKDLLRVVARLHVLGTGGFWGAFIDQDSKNSTRYLLHLWQGGLGLPERDYYLLNTPEQKRVRAAYIAHIGTLLKLAKFSAQEIKQIQKSVMKIETALAEASMKKEDTRDPEKIYHKYSLAQLQKLTPHIDWPAYFKQTHTPKIRELVVGQPEFFKGVNYLLETISIAEWKHYLEWHLINGHADMLSLPFLKADFKFYGTVLSGTKKMKPLWRQALSALRPLGEVVGKLYVEKHFPPSSKRAMDALVSNLFAVYEERIMKLDWMSSATKKKAVQKLRLMSRKIGYPKKWERYADLVMKKDDFFGNILRLEEWHHKKQMRKLRKAVDRNEWFMTPQTVNAYFSPNLNDIVFPAAILQWPFFDPRADMAINYAGIGSVIGHEMTHGFDDQGAKFDGRGNMRNWWTASDKKKFEAKGKLLKEQYDAYVAAPGVKVNGQLTLGENIADLGGLVIAWDAYQKYLAKVGRKMIAGFSPEVRFFLGFAQMERELARAEFAKTHALTDPHSPAPARINGPLANFEPFYQTFKVTHEDKLYRPLHKRAKIW